MTAASVQTTTNIWSSFTTARATGRTAPTQLVTDSSSDGEGPTNTDNHVPVPALDNDLTTKKGKLAHAVVDKLICIAEELVADEDGVQKRSRPHDQTSINVPRRKSKVVLAKYFVDTTLLPLMKDLNSATKQLPVGHTREQATRIYKQLCKNNHVLHSPTVQNYFKVDQFIKCSVVIFPETALENITIRFAVCFDRHITFCC